MSLLLLASYGAIPFVSLATPGAANYIAPIFVAVWDFVFFATSPSGATIPGMLSIIGAGLLVLRR